MLKYFQKTLCERSWDISLNNFGPNWAQIVLFLEKMIFWKNWQLLLLSTYFLPLSCNCPFPWKDDFLEKLTITTLVYLLFTIKLQCLKKVLRLGNIMRYKVLQFWAKSDTNHSFTNKGDFIEKLHHKAWNNEASIAKYVKYTWKSCVKSTIKASEQWE